MLRLLRLVTFLAVAACGTGDDTAIVVATTTSVDDSGLLDVLVPAFEAAHPDVMVRVIAVGSSEAFEMGRRKDADLLITHNAWEDAQFVMRGHGTESSTIMYNHFVVVGPESDPAGVRQATSASDALLRIANTGATFLTRGDSSGTHAKEMFLWRRAEFQPDPATHEWYVESGVGMGDLLRIAGERGAYTLADRATFLTIGATTDLVVLYGEVSELLYNPYAATLVAGASHPEEAGTFYRWLRSDDGQQAIEDFRTENQEAPLFHPARR
jgi:tungstate transport system substrate-binding protein